MRLMGTEVDPTSHEFDKFGLFNEAPKKTALMRTPIWYALVLEPYRQLIQVQFTQN